MSDVVQQQEGGEHDVWFRRQVEIGRASADAGNLIPASEVEAKFEARREVTRSRLKGEA